MLRFIIYLTLVFITNISAFAQSGGSKDGPKLLNKVEFYTVLQKQIPPGWKLAVRGDIYVVYYENVYTVTAADYEKIPKESEGKEEAWVKKNGHSLPYEIKISFEDCYIEYTTPTVGIKSQSTLDQIGEKYGVATQVLNSKAAANADVNKLIPDPVTGLFLASSNEERNRLAMFALSRELLLNVPVTVQTSNMCNVSDTQTDKKYATKVDYNVNYRKIYPERITADAENIANSVKLILMPR
ncbi:MAG: hypothetical protein KA168_02550 [Chitinophagales bacterium]|jgi:hypothetical protein|nr:hypothetical protein [Chitinophagales bacterium]